MVYNELPKKGGVTTMGKPDVSTHPLSNSFNILYKHGLLILAMAGRTAHSSTEFSLCSFQSHQALFPKAGQTERTEDTPKNHYD